VKSLFGLFIAAITTIASVHAQPARFVELPMVGNCPVFPADNPWNWDVRGLPVDPMSETYVASISAGGNEYLHADFGGGGEYGLPYVVVGADQPRVPITFTDYGDESDPGPYPIPPDVPIENGGDRHVIAVDGENCMLYELYGAEPNGEGWNAASGAVFDLLSNRLRPTYWTSADAAGLPIFAGLVRYDEVVAGEIRHALRFTVERTQRGFIPPATHFASDSDDPALPPMGLRMRLRADFDTSAFYGQARVVLEALKVYGMILADNGTSWFITGASDPRWDDEDLNQLNTISNPRPSLYEGLATTHAFSVDTPLPTLDVPLAHRDSFELDFDGMYRATYETLSAYSLRVDYAQLPANFEAYSADDQARMAVVAAAHH
jgi:hypothetical protein